MTIAENKSAGPSWPPYVALLVLIALFAGLITDAGHQVGKGNFGAFVTFYPAADALRQGKNPYAATHGIFSYVYPPFYAFVLQPLTRLPRETAARIMLAVNGTCILAALLLGAAAMLSRMGSRVNLSNIVFAALVAGLVAIVPIHNELRGLETNSILLLSFVLGLYWLDRRPVASGLALAVGVSIKYLPIIAVPYLLLRRRWTTAGATLAGSILLALVPATTLGWATNLEYLQFSASGLLHLTGVHTEQAAAQVHTTDEPTSISVSSALARFLARSGRSKAAATAMTAGVAGVWIVLILAAYRERQLPWLRWPAAHVQRARPFAALVAVEWAGLVTFALAFSPNTQNRNLVLATVPAALAAVLIFSSTNRRMLALLLGVMVVMCAALVLPVGGMGRPFTDFWTSGGLACWGLLAEYVIISHSALARLSASASKPPG